MENLFLKEIVGDNGNWFGIVTDSLLVDGSRFVSYDEQDLYGDEYISKEIESKIEDFYVNIGLSQSVQGFIPPSFVSYMLSKNNVNIYGSEDSLKEFSNLLGNYAKIDGDSFEITKSELENEDIDSKLFKGSFCGLDTTLRRLKDSESDYSTKLYENLLSKELSIKTMNYCNLVFNGYEAIIIGERVFVFNRRKIKLKILD